MAQLEKERTQAHSEKLLYTAKIHTTGGRDHGVARSSDGRLDVRLSTPGSVRHRHQSGATARRRLVGLFRKRDGRSRPAKRRSLSRLTSPSTPKWT